MKQLIEGFVTVFLVVLSALILVQFIGAAMQIRTARQFHTICIGEIEASDFDKSVIALCKEKANQHGYELKVDYMKAEEMVCRSCNFAVAEETAVCAKCNRADTIAYDREQTCEVSLYYTIQMALVKLEKKGVLKGFAR